MRRMYSENQLLKGIESQAQENGLKVFENIVDKDGHDRFIEGDVNLEEVTGIAKLYGKWSLSGSHLMIVLCFSVENGLSLSTTLLANIPLPKWIKDKMVPVFTNNIIPYVTVVAANETYTTTQNFSLALRKQPNDDIVIYLAGATTTDKRFARIQFDLLIDNE